MMTTIRWSFSVWVFLAMMGASIRAEEMKPAVPPQKVLPLPGEVLSIRGHTAFVLAPTSPGKLIPWVLYAPTLPGLPGTEEKWMFERFLEAGIALSLIHISEPTRQP
jgi:hypothetical protein